MRRVALNSPQLSANSPQFFASFPQLSASVGKNFLRLGLYKETILQLYFGAA